MNNKNYSTKQEEKSNKRIFRQLTRKDRYIIEDCINKSKKKNYDGPKITCEYLAKKLGFSRSAISRELKRGLMSEPDGKGHTSSNYRAEWAISERTKSSKRSHYKTKLQANCPELKYITKCLRKGEDVFSAMIYYEEKYNKPFPVCEKTLYNYYHKHLIKGIKPYKHYETVKKVGKMVQKGLNISERPFKPEDRTEFGHWEGDLIVGAKGKTKDCLLTLIERQTRFYYAVKIKSKETKSVIDGLNGIEAIIGNENFKTIFKTITFDNGCEFRDYNGMELSIDKENKRTVIYYANPYHSWERGSNERGNRMMRKFFPKGTDFSLVEDHEILKALGNINYSKRKILDKQTSFDLIKKLEDNISIIFEKFGLKNNFCNFEIVQ